MMTQFIKIGKTKEIFILICIFQICNGLPASKSALSNHLQQKRDINLIQDKLIHTSNPQPILDTITDAEKCCNLQQHLPGKKLLSVFEQLTSVAANVVQIPKQKIDNIGAGVTEYLNQIGAKLVGLQK